MVGSRVLAVAVAMLFLFGGLLVIGTPAGAHSDTIEGSDGSILGSEDSLFLITPAQYRLVYPFDNPVLFGIKTVPLVGLTYEDGSGLTEVIKLDLTDGTHILHAAAPSVSENTVFEFTLIATLGEVTEYLTLKIYIGNYNVTVDFGDGDDTDPDPDDDENDDGNGETPDDEDKDKNENKRKHNILIASLVILFALLFAGGFLMGMKKPFIGSIVCIASIILCIMFVWWF